LSLRHCAESTHGTLNVFTIICAASVERITVSRAGHFSCPVRTGVVLLGDWRRVLGAGADGRIRCNDQAALACMQVSLAVQDPLAIIFDTLFMKGLGGTCSGGICLLALLSAQPAMGCQQQRTFLG
jgi:hypothetical protein